MDNCSRLRSNGRGGSGESRTRRGRPRRLTMDVTSAKIVELRVHGVSGTPPEEMLETHHARQEAGDEYSRFFVAVDCFGDKPPDPVEDGTGPHVRSTRLEGFHWGRYTSGNWRQALWLALVPFGMVNAAQFMLSPPSSWRERFFHTVVGRGAAAARPRADGDVRAGRVLDQHRPGRPAAARHDPARRGARGGHAPCGGRVARGHWRAGPLPAGAAQHDRAPAARRRRHPRPLAGRDVRTDPGELLRRRPRRHQPRAPPPRGRLGDGGPRRQPDRR